jgi:nickel/cobalt exporter
MLALPDLLHQGSAHAWLFIPIAILLGALHGLEPGHSKTMMAAFIIAIRGTVGQAILLGVSAAISHTAVVWLVALGGQYLGRNLDGETVEPYLQLVSGLIVACIAGWMIWRTYREQRADHSGHSHHHADTRRIDTGHGVLALDIVEAGVPPRWRIRFESGHAWPVQDVRIETERPDGTRQGFRFIECQDCLQSADIIPEPHDFTARLSLDHGGHIHDYVLVFAEAGHGLDLTEQGAAMDAHQRAHADDIARRFRGGKVSNGQILLFGLTGGLIPCPAAITVLLLCLQLKQITLAVVLVGFFSVGLALTMVSAGVVASLSVRHVGKHWPGFGKFAARAPYASAALMLAIAVYMVVSGGAGLERLHSV